MTTIDEVQLKRGTAANLESINPVLAAGEPCWDITNNIIKVGDGTTPWNDLETPYSSAYAGSEFEAFEDLGRLSGDPIEWTDLDDYRALIVLLEDARRNTGAGTSLTRPVSIRLNGGPADSHLQTTTLDGTSSPSALTHWQFTFITDSAGGDRHTSGVAYVGSNANGATGWMRSTSYAEAAGVLSLSRHVAYVGSLPVTSLRLVGFHSAVTITARLLGRKA